MRLAVFANSGVLGGSDLDLLELLEAVQAYDAGFRAMYIAPSDGPAVDRARQLGLEAVIEPYEWMRTTADDLATLPEAFVRQRYARGLAASHKLVRGPLAAFSPQVLMTQGCVLPWGAYAARALGRPHIWNIREFGEDDHGLVPTLDGVTASAEIGALSDHVFFSCCEVQNHWRMQRVSNSVLYSRPKLASGSVTALNPRSPAGNGLRIGWVGTLIEGKRPDVFVRAAAAFLRHEPSTTFLIIGDGPDRQRLQGMAYGLGLGRNLIFTGYVQSPISMIATCDAIVSTSRREALGRTLRECTALGCIPVHPDTAAWREVFSPGETSLVWDAEDENSLAATLQLLVPPDDRRRLRERVLDLARRENGLPDPAPLFHRVADRLANRAPRHSFPSPAAVAAVLEFGASAVDHLGNESDPTAIS